METKQDIEKRELKTEIEKLRNENKVYETKLIELRQQKKDARDNEEKKDLNDEIQFYRERISSNDRQIEEILKQITDLAKKRHAPRMPVVQKIVKAGENTDFAKNALSVVAFVAVSIASGLVASTFATWTSGRAWGFLVIAALVCVIRQWKSKDEGYVIEYEDTIEADEESDDVAPVKRARPTSQRSHISFRSAGS